MAQDLYISDAQRKSVISDLVATHGEDQRDRIEKGVHQVTQFWRDEDGSGEEFAAFCGKYFITDPEVLQKTADRYEAMFESIRGHLTEMERDLRWNIDVETGTLLPVDYLFFEYSPGAHVNDDMFRTKIAFVCLLNFPLYTLEERLKLGPGWAREEWAQARLAEMFSARVPSEVSQQIDQARAVADNYISEYNIFMHHILTPEGERPFPRGLRLITHWNLRDELKAQYASPKGLPKQEMIYQIMQKIIRQEIPNAVINNPAVDWTLSTNEVTVSSIVDGDIPKTWTEQGEPGTAVDNSREPDTRYARLLGMFKSEQGADPYYPTTPTKMDRRFQRNREIPEDKVEALFDAVLSSEALANTGKLIERRLGRELRPFDIWYDGFKARGAYNEEELDKLVSERYPTVEAFQADMPNLLRKLGFTPETARYLATKIDIDPSRGIGHAMEPGRRSDKAHLRTRVPETGMNYKGYNIAIHEFGHNVEQVFSLGRVDHTLLRGVPNTAFTEGFAFVFQARDLELLGLTKDDPETEHLKALDNIWSTAEIASVALVDMKVWHWMYDHPEATPAELKEAVIGIAKDVWNRYYAPIFGEKDVDLLAIYSHMIDAGLYLPDYPLGHIIAFQVEEYMKDKNLATEMERMCKLGSITPDQWMQQAVGQSISAEPMILAAEEALKMIKD
ncbi:MAG: hypothetical protein JSV84_12340 [Gemmatimonadota bacterium]|nr:MAG: hypothetical protein JSV84_12340 [Gemmatimonadota bacterium]